MKSLNKIIEEIKEAVKANKSQFIFSLIVIMICNISTLYAFGEKFESDRQKFKAKLVQDVNESKEHDELKERAEEVAKAVLLKNKNKGREQVFYDTLPLENKHIKEKNESSAENDGTLGDSSTQMSQTVDHYLNNFINIDEETLGMLAKRLKEYSDHIENSMSKKELLDTGKDKGELTISNMDFFTVEEKLAFICEKYNLTDFELKVVISVLYHEAGWTYEDAFKVSTVIYNRTKSKESIRYTHHLTKLDGESLYSQVVATSHTKDGKKVQQFDGYLPDVAGYDYEKLLASDPDKTKLNAFLDCLILLKLGEEYENPTFPLAPCFSNMYFWGDGVRNHFNGPISTSDVVDGYQFPDYEYTESFTRDDVLNLANEYTLSAKKRVRK